METRRRPACFATPLVASTFFAASPVIGTARCPQRCLKPESYRNYYVKKRTIIQTSAPLSTSEKDTSMELKVGDRIKVVGEEIFMYHFPKSRNVPILVTGKTGTIVKDISIQDGLKISATAPYVVKLDDYPKSMTHFADHEIEVISDEEASE